ncbi:MAG: hypothetical protein K0S53_1249 [Bacteroidetes bacterium]|jgi:hypothetical protein|nr:hypothetical protein [Bacteroidota bacterium]MDF2452957.1 hypothetical protein [Bacteroidota bacterium]
MITIKKDNQLISLHIEADLINTSDTRFDLQALKKSILTQLQNVYNKKIGKYDLQISFSIRVLKHIYQCSPKKVLLQVVNTIPGNNPAEADFKGLRIKLNKHYVTDIMANKNIRTIPHEIGHLLGWEHPHANAKYESVNLSAHPLEKQLTETERQCNLMSQSWYAQKAGVPLNKAMELTEKQIELLFLNEHKLSLNKNRHLNYFLWWKKIV